MGRPFAASVTLLIPTWQSVIRGHHIYKHIWQPLVGEMLTLEREEGNNHDKFAVSLLKNATVIGHVPEEFSRVFWHFLSHKGIITCELTGQKKCGNGLDTHSLHSSYYESTVLLATFKVRLLSTCA